MVINIKKFSYIIVFLIIIILGLNFFDSFFCAHFDGYGCKNIELVGQWKSENDYHLSVDGIKSDDNPIYENSDFCTLYLKEKSLKYEEFLETMVKIPRNPNFTITNNDNDIFIKYELCYGFGDTMCPTDYLKSKPVCFFYKLLKEKDPSVALSMCSFILPKQTERACYYYVSLKFARTNPDEALRVCDKTVFFGLEAEHCYEDVAVIVAETDIHKAVEICENNEIQCLSDVIEIHQNNTGISGKGVVYECLNLEMEDKLTGLICKYNHEYLMNWQGHAELLNAFGIGYENASYILCNNLLEIGVWRALTTEICMSTRDRFLKSINEKGSKQNLFVINYPNGFGEKYLIS